MGQIHNQLYRGKLSEAATRAVGVTKGAGGLERFGETLQLVLDLWRQPDHAILRGETLAAIRITQAAVAGEFSIVALLNPSGSGLLMTVTGVKAISGAISTELLVIAEQSIIDGTLGTSSAGPVRDRRAFSGRQFSDAAFGRAGSDLVGLVGSLNLDQAAVPAAGGVADFTQGLPVVLPPGHGVGIVGQTVNTSTFGVFTYSTRLAYPGELL